jgi:hypothetical protein
MQSQLKVYPDGVSTPRYVDADTAAQILGLSLDEFQDLIAELVTKRLLKAPNPRRQKYDIKALDHACDRLSGLDQQEPPKKVEAPQKKTPTEALDEWLDKKYG